MKELSFKTIEEGEKEGKGNSLSRIGWGELETIIGSFTYTVGSTGNTNISLGTLNAVLSPLPGSATVGEEEENNESQ